MMIYICTLHTAHCTVILYKRLDLSLLGDIYRDLYYE